MTCLRTIDFVATSTRFYEQVSGKYVLQNLKLYLTLSRARRVLYITDFFKHIPSITYKYPVKFRVTLQNNENQTLCVRTDVCVTIEQKKESIFFKSIDRIKQQ